MSLCSMHPGLRRPTHRPGTVQRRHHAMPQTLRRSRDLPAPQSATHRDEPNTPNGLTLYRSFRVSAVAKRTGALGRGGSRFRDEHSCRWGGATVVPGVRVAPFCPGARDGCSGGLCGRGFRRGRTACEAQVLERARDLRAAEVPAVLASDHRAHLLDREPATADPYARAGDRFGLDALHRLFDVACLQKEGTSSDSAAHHASQAGVEGMSVTAVAGFRCRLPFHARDSSQTLPSSEYSKSNRLSRFWQGYVLGSGVRVRPLMGVSPGCETAIG